MKALLKKTSHNTLTPSNQETQRWFDGLKIGAEVHGPLRQRRILWKHRKYFALLNIAYDHWEPGEIDSKYGKPEKNFDRFRKDIAILCGYYSVVVRLDGTTRIEADSISFAKMDQVSFEKLYTKTIDLLIKQVYNSKMPKQQIESMVNEYLKFE